MTHPLDRYEPEYGNPIADWHKVFAWLPVDTVDRGIVWLHFVYRRRIQKKDHIYLGPSRWWQYVKEKPQ